jgi:hypothetical protein
MALPQIAEETALGSDTQPVPIVPGPRPPARPDPRRSPAPRGVDATLQQLLLVGGLAVGALQAVVGLVWWVVDLATVPAYGDTSEYLALAGTLRVDTFRTLAYPLLVRLSADTAARTGLPLQVPLYLLQTAVVVAAAWYAVRSFAPRLSRARVAGATAFVAASPLVLHYAVSLLSDSLAGSLLVVALAALGRVLVHGDRRVRTAVALAGATAGATLVRAEKGTVLLAIVALVLVGLLAVHWRRTRHRRPGTPLRAVAGLVVLSVVVPAIGATVLNHATQTADYGRPRLGLVSVAMSSVVWPHLSEIRDQLPARAREAISPEDAAAFDSTMNAVLPMTKRMQDLDGGGDAITGAAIRAALRCCAPAVAGTLATHSAEYAVAPLLFAKDGLPATLPGAPAPVAGGAPTLWDVSRMAAAHPGLTRGYLWVSWAATALLVGAGLLRWRRAGAARAVAPRALGAVVLIAWLGTVVNGVFFAAAGGADPNVRYAVANVMVLTAALVVWVLCTVPAGRPLRGRGTPVARLRTAG